MERLGKDGYIQKEELWTFVSSGKAGDMNINDFDALFAAMDIDKNGKVDFMEFCAFMSLCGEAFTEEKAKQIKMGRRRSSAISKSARLSDVVRRLSSMPNNKSIKEAADAIEDPSEPFQRPQTLEEEA
jgi:hypothetical protein